VLTSPPLAHRRTPGLSSSWYMGLLTFTRVVSPPSKLGRTRQFRNNPLRVIDPLCGDHVIDSDGWRAPGVAGPLHLARLATRDQTHRNAAGGGGASGHTTTGRQGHRGATRERGNWTSWYWFGAGLQGCTGIGGVPCARPIDQCHVRPFGRKPVVRNNGTDRTFIRRPPLAYCSMSLPERFT
jgi:hypothetical protein